MASLCVVINNVPFFNYILSGPASYQCCNHDCDPTKPLMVQLMVWSVVINKTWDTGLCNVSCGVMDFDAEHHPWQSRALMRTEDMCPNQMQIAWHLHQYYLAWSWYNVHMYMLCNNRRYLLRIPDDRKQATCTVITHCDGTDIRSDHMHNCRWSTCNAKQIPCGCTALTDPCACLTKSFESW